jgi:hypothetical protein
MDQTESCAKYIRNALSQAKASGRLTDSQLLSFACRCSRRVLPLCDHPVARRVLECAEKRAAGSLTKEEMDSIAPEFDALYNELYRGYGTPTADVLALSAISEAAYTADPLTATINAVLFVADAAATAAATKADRDNGYDAIYDAAHRAECEAQMKLFEQI